MKLMKRHKPKSKMLTLSLTLKRIKGVPHACIAILETVGGNGSVLTYTFDWGDNSNPVVTRQRIVSHIYSDRRSTPDRYTILATASQDGPRTERHLSGGRS